MHSLLFNTELLLQVLPSKIVRLCLLWAAAGALSAVTKENTCMCVQSAYAMASSLTQGVHHMKLSHDDTHNHYLLENVPLECA